MFHRCINLPKSNSFFLFGARGTGKSTIVKDWQTKDSVYIDLLLGENESRYALDPDLLYREFRHRGDLQYVIIDEIQKVPRLLDIVHKLIEETSLKFILTGSSARKLKAGSANLLAGRAFERTLHPITAKELGDRFDVDKVLRWGSLPAIFKFAREQDKNDYLRSYGNTYLKEEIWGEHLIRKLDPFRKFLQIAAQHNTKILNFSKIARDVGVDSKVIKNYFQILEDTWLGFILEPYHKSARKRVTKAPKFYFFDVGVVRSLAQHLTLEPLPSTSYYGELFEQLVILEFIRKEKYEFRDYQFYYISSENNEIDLLIERPGKPLACIEIKSATSISEENIRKMRYFFDSFDNAEFYCLSQDKREQCFENIKAMHWLQGLEEI